MYAQGQGQRPRAPGCYGAGAAEGSYLMPKVRAAAERSYPTSKERRLHGCKRAERRYYTHKVRRGGREEIPLIQGKEQWLLFAGAAMKR